MIAHALPQVFDALGMQRVDGASLDAALADDGAIRILFLWGHGCPDCEIAKRQLLVASRRFTWPDVRWLHGDVHEDGAMATRFGLHGIPAFIVFRGAVKLGRIGAWPGQDAFIDAIERVRASDPD